MSKAAISEAQALRAGSMLDQAPSERRMEFVQTVMNRALELYRGGQFDSAEVLFETVASEPAVRPRIQHIRGLIALQSGEDERALDLLEEVIQLDPSDGEAHANLGVLLLKARQNPQALAAFAAALTLQPDNAAALLGLARALAALDLSDLAHDAIRDVLAHAPDYVEAILEFGWLLSDTGRHDEGVTMLRDALQRHPKQDQLRTVLAVCLFGVGDWPAAWAEYEGRLSDPRVSKHLLRTDRPRWLGEELAGKTILLQSEQGFGDTLQFVRYAPMVKARGGRVILRTPRVLLPLMRTVAGIDDVVDDQTTALAFDVHAPLLSLPLVSDTRIDTVPAVIPYIAPDAQLAARWRERLSDHFGGQSGVSVGLVWQGNPAHLNDQRRSIRFDALRPLLDCPNARFISLQVGAGREQLTEFDDCIIDPGAEIDIGSFADTAAIVANLDLVISIDNAIVHLAGAMGKPVWVLLAKSSDWRWLRDRDDTPWYPQARLFRQTRPGDWAGVVGRLRTELWSFAGAEVPLPADRTLDPITASALHMTSLPRAADPVLCDALFVEACRHHHAGNFDRARKLYVQVLIFEPEHINTLCNLGALELVTGHGERAIMLLQTAMMHAPDLAPARIALGDALLDAKQNEQALAQYRKAIELAPTSVAAHVAYASALRKLGEAGAATGIEPDVVKRMIHQHYRKALELAPNDDTVHAQYALALCELGDLDNAMMHFLAATKINQQQSAEFYEALGCACAARGNSQGAEISLKHALALDPQRVTARCALGDLYLATARPDDAQTSFREALTIDAENAVALRGIERVHASHSTMAIHGMA
ncbi:tetratricopeptide repeat protein [Bradyrhizobium sp. Ai1a-2]|uniref:tetratricopeptide repeat protein n=1 Tax=Bradyrhizobium sp. Ai1a-2 TaxID=196490 RepID=UPI00040FAFED|nr:tetratricopeptide repeat protein [Bradyrhizobium sp. Ai1a-2]